MKDFSINDLIEKANKYDETSVLFFNRNPYEYLKKARNHKFLKLNSRVSEIDGELYRRI